MTDAANVLSILDYITSAGEPVSGGSIEFYQAGTSTARTVYSDSALSTSLGTIVYTDSEGFPVSTQGGSTRVSIYTGVNAYKVIVKNSAGTTLFTRDNIPGALDTSGFTTTSALPTVPVSAKTAAYTITTSDRGYLFNANPTGGTFVMTLPSAVTAGDNFAVGIRHNGTANQVTLATVSSQYIRGPGTPTSYFSLVGRGEEVWLTSDGADWIVTSYVPALIRPGVIPPVLHITDRLTAAPGSPTAGARYIVNGTATGTWSTLGFAQHDIAEADGNGSWIKYTPADGWVAYVADEALLTQYRTSAWTDLSNITSPSSANLECALFLDQKADGTAGGAVTTGAWTTSTLNTSKTNTITGCSLATNAITLPAGSYAVTFSKHLGAANGQGIRLKLATGPVYYEGINNSISGSENVTLTGHAAFTLASSDTVTLEYYAQNSGDANDQGSALSISGNLETYASVLILDLSSMQGATGSQGAQGTDGLDAAYPYQWSTSTSGDPGTGKVAGNNATIASITQLQISETDSAGGSMAAVIATWDDSTSSNRATVKISKEGATQNFHAFQITGAGTDAGTYWTFPVTYIATSGTISNADSCAVLVIEKGDKCDTGATGSAGVYSFDYTFSTTTTSGPSTGTIRANNATLSSATALYIHETDRLGVSQAAAIAQWDDSTTTVKGYLTLVDLTTPANKVRFSITGANVDNGSDDTITVTYVSGVTSLTAVNVAVLFERSGDKGADGAGSGDFVGPASSTDNAIVRFDSTTGKLGQNSTVTVSDTGAIAGVQAITLAADDGGALGASGTAFSDLFLADGGVINWATGAMTITGVAGATDQMYFQGAANGYFFSNVVGPYTNDGAALGIATTNMWSDLFLASGAVINFNAGDVTVTHSADALTFAGAASGYLFSHAPLPQTSDVAALGSATLMWSDLFLASGGVINFNNGDVTVTHSANTLAFGGASSGYAFDALATITSASASALTVGANGGTNPVLKIDAATVSVATGISVTGAAAAGRAAVAVISSGTNEGLSIDAKGSGTVRLGATSTGAIEHSRDAVPTASDGAGLGTASLMWADLFLASGSVINWNASNVTLTHSAATLTLAGATSLAMGTAIAVGLGTIELGHASDTTLARVSAGVISVEGETVHTNSIARTASVLGIEVGHATDTTITRSSAGVIAVEGVTVSLNSTSAVHTASTIELGAASDTTISRSAAGVIAVEGVPLYSNIPQNSQSAAYTTVLADAQKHILHPSADTTARTITIDSNANVAYPIGTAITFVNQASAGVMSIAITTDTMRLAGAGTTGTRALAANGIATALKITSTEWIISGTGLT